MKIYITGYVKSQNIKFADSNDMRYLESKFYQLQFVSIDDAVHGIMEDRLLQKSYAYTMGFDVDPEYNILVMFDPDDTACEETDEDFDYVDHIREQIEAKWPVFIRSIK